MVLLLWWQIVLLFNKKCSSTCYHGIWHHNISTNWCHNSSTMTTCNRKHSWLSCIQQQILFKILRIVLTCTNTILIIIHYCHKVRGQGPRSLSEQDWILMDITLLNCEYNFNTRGHQGTIINQTPGVTTFVVYSNWPRCGSSAAMVATSHPSSLSTLW